MTIKNRIFATTLAATVALGGVAALQAQDAPQVPGAVDPARVAGGTYTVDPAHTLVQWEVSHFGFNDYFGLFGEIEGKLQLNPEDLSASSLEVSVPVSSVAVVSEGLHDHLLRPGKDGGEPDFFGPKPAPARFVSTEIRRLSPTEAVIFGNLTLNGVTRQVPIIAEFTGAGANPMSKVPTVGFSGRATINRSDFGIDYGIPMVADKVELEISAAFEKK